MEHTIPYGKTELRFSLPPAWQVEVIAPPKAQRAEAPYRAVEYALKNPVGGLGLETFRGAKTAAIAINDKTRPVPHQHLLPPLLQALHEIGLPAPAITLLIATGTHPPMPPDEFTRVLPEEIVRRYPVLSHDSEDRAALAYLGQTTRGTPVWVNRAYASADLRIVVGNIEPHQFQGFSGGVKSAAIGLAGRDTINHNHALMTAPGSELGAYTGNPARQDVEEIGRIIGVHFALNAVLNLQKEIVRVIAGDPWAVMQTGIPLAREICQVTVREPYDLVIASPGGLPKDINLYQAQKGLAHAVRALRPGGVVVLAAACREGTGSQGYEAWIKDKTSLAEVLRRFASEGFRVGPHKAWQLARDASRFRTFLISDMDPDFVRSLLLTPAADISTALDLAGLDTHRPLRVGILPYANATIPELAGDPQPAS